MGGPERLGCQALSYLRYLRIPTAQVPEEAGWLQRQTCPVIAVGEGAAFNADVVVNDDAAADQLAARIEQNPVAALALVQVLRCVEQLSIDEAMSVESLAYAALQGGTEFRGWLQSREASPELVVGSDGPAVIILRDGDELTAILNRPSNRNSLTVEMRDALIELLELVLIDTNITHLKISGAGGCFSIGGELREFGLAQDPASAHWIRSVHNPGRLLARCAPRVSCHLHSACIGSGIELPAFAQSVTAHENSFFQLPELGFGLIPGAGGCVSITRRIGRQRTAWLALSGKKIKARKALAWGLIDNIVNAP